MITDALLNLIYFFVSGIVLIFSAFGDVTVSASITSGIEAIKPYYIALEGILPIATILSIIAFDVVFEGSLLLYRLIRWGYQKVPGIN